MSIASRTLVERTATNSVNESATVATAVSESLAMTFGTSFDIWFPSDLSWVRFDETSTTLGVASTITASHDQQQLLDRVRDQELLILPEQDGLHMVLLSISVDRRNTVVAMGAVHSNDDVMLERLVLSFLSEWRLKAQIQSLEDETQAFVRQVTTDLEELVFLRQMAEHLEINENADGLLDLDGSLFGMLASAIKCKYLALIEADPVDEARYAGETEVGKIVHWYGDDELSKSCVLRLLSRYRTFADSQPVVRNLMTTMVEGVDFPNIESFILVQICTGNRTYGWMVAINRWDEHRYLDYVPNDPASDAEFGTGEATLLNSAASMLATHARNVELFREQEHLLTNTVRALVYAVEAKDRYTCGHSERVALYGQALAERVGLDHEECERLYLTGLLHDIGKIGIRDAVLGKEGKLTDEEFDEIKKHPDGGWAILQDLQQLRYTLPGILYHHERYDGRGYPDGLAGKNIPLDGRILAVADAYDAMTSDRPYRQGMPHDKAVGILREGSGTQWDPEMIDHFLAILPQINDIRNTYHLRPAPKRQGGTLVEE